MALCRGARQHRFGELDGWSRGALLAFDVLLDDGRRGAAAGTGEVGAGPEDRPHPDVVDPAGVKVTGEESRHRTLTTTRHDALRPLL